jgi:hypothetical protein
MSASPPDLIVRRHERYGCGFPAQVRVAPAHAAAVRPARSVGGGDGSVPAEVVDCSLGGVGLRSDVFLPLTCRLIVSFSDGRGRIESEARIQRVAMVDRAPAYYLGTCFEDPTDQTLEAVRALVSALRAAGAPLVQEAPGA